jgi:DNA polymerase I-like protein with 3'-5' exonuclease and polymerase domains/uracil-DNA glycosylase
MVVIGQAPSGFSIGKDKAFYGQQGRLFMKFLSHILKRDNGKYANIRIYATYSALVGAYKPNVYHVQACQGNLHKELSSIRGINGREPVLVPLGPLALSSIGVKARKITDVVGRIMSTQIRTPMGDRTFDVVPLLSMEHVGSQPGTANVVLAALLKAVQIAAGEEGVGTLIPLEDVTKDYVFPQTIEEVTSLVDLILPYTDQNGRNSSDNWPIALDTETNTLEPYRHPDPRTLMLSVAWDRGKAATILLDHAKTPYDREEAWIQVRRLLECPKPKVFHNWKFDYKFLERVNGATVNRVAWDTMLGEHYLDEDKKRMYSLKQLTPIYAPMYTGYDDTLQKVLRGEDDGTLRLKNVDISTMSCPVDRDRPAWDALVAAITERKTIGAITAANRTKKEKAEFIKAGEDIKDLRETLKIKKPATKKEVGAEVEGFAAIPLDTILQYAGVDADVTRIIFIAQTARLRRTNLWEEGLAVMKNQYLPASYVLSDMEYGGFEIDTGHLSALKNGVQERMDEAAKYVSVHFSTGMNLNSPAQVAKLMQGLGFENLPGIEPGTTGKDALKKFIKHYPESDKRYQFAAAVLQFRECHKTMNSFLNPIGEFAAGDGRVHANFNLHGTSSGRLSCSRPNLQQTPKITARSIKKNPETGKDEVVFPGFNVKKLFVPSKPKHLIVNCDISGAELRVYTAYSHDKMMIDALNKGMDVHSLVTSKVYKMPYEQVMELKDAGDPEITKKRTNCKRVVFGSFYGAGPTKIAEQIESTFEEAKALRTFLFTEFPALPQYINDVTEQVRSRQMVKTYFGRCRRFRMAHMTARHFQEAKREAVNFLIQSTSSDLVLSQMCEAARHLKELGGRMLITVHDSVVFEIPEDVVRLETAEIDGKKKLVDTRGILHDFFDHWIVARVKEKYPWLPVAFEFDIEIGPSYGEVKSVIRAA